MGFLFFYGGCMEKKYILALDQGTTSSRAIIFDREGNIVAVSQNEFNQIYPKAGWVEHDAMEIWGTQSGVAREVLDKAGITSQEIAALGITNQRETAILWDKNTGRPIYNAIVWQCRRGAPLMNKLEEEGLSDLIKEKTGLVMDAYFSASKIAWLLDNVEGAREKAEAGDLLFGTVDTWLIWNLTKGKVHATDYSNASRTMLFNIRELKWDKDLLRIFNIPEKILPKVMDSSGLFAYTHEGTFLGAKIPITGVCGDQQGALFGQASFKEGMAKNTYGTGCFLLMNTGEKLIKSENGLLTTIAWSIKGKVTYALEGSIFMGGASVQWLRDELKLVYDAAQTEYYANMVDDTNGVYVIPAFTGLGAPYWDMYARGTIVGLTRGVKREHLVRATLESIAYQTRDVIGAMEEDSKINLSKLKVDGGASRNNFLMQFQADILKVPVERPKVTETTALGAAYLAGLAVGYWKDLEEIERNWKVGKNFLPSMDEALVEKKYRLWKKAVKRSMNWAKEEEEVLE